MPIMDKADSESTENTSPGFSAGFSKTISHIIEPFSQGTSNSVEWTKSHLTWLVVIGVLIIFAILVGFLFFGKRWTRGNWKAAAALIIIAAVWISGTFMGWFLWYKMFDFKNVFWLNEIMITALAIPFALPQILYLLIGWLRCKPDYKGKFCIAPATADKLLSKINFVTVFVIMLAVAALAWVATTVLLYTHLKADCEEFKIDAGETDPASVRWGMYFWWFFTSLAFVLGWFVIRTMMGGFKGAYTGWFSGIKNFFCSLWNVLIRHKWWALLLVGSVLSAIGVLLYMNHRCSDVDRDQSEEPNWNRMLIMLSFAVSIIALFIRQYGISLFFNFFGSNMVTICGTDQDPRQQMFAMSLILIIGMAIFDWLVYGRHHKGGRAEAPASE
jgi:hypothetical protein